MINSSIWELQNPQRPFNCGGPRRTLTLPLSEIHPIVRIAHHVCYPLDTAERIIFDYELVLVLAGTGEVIFDQDRCRFAAHDLLFIPPFLPHRFSDARTGASEHIAVHFDFSPHAPGPVTDRERQGPYEVRLGHGMSLPRRLPGAGRFLEQKLFEVVRERAGLAPSAEIKAICALLSVIVAMLEPELSPALRADRSAARTHSEAQVRQVSAFMQAEPGAALTAQALAARAGMSVSRFNLLFRQVTGYSPLDFLRRARVEEARRLLADPALSMKEIAARVGFDDSLHFSKVFRRLDGLPPTLYRAALLASHPQQFESEK